MLASYLERDLGEALKRLDWAPIFKVIGQILASGTLLNFQQSRSPDGVPWKPLKRPRRRSRAMGRADAAKGEADKPLQDSGLLKGSVTDVNSPDHFENYSGTLFTYGSNVEYGPFHQWGAKYIPIREFLGLNDFILESVQSFLSEEIARQLGGPPGA